MNFKLFCAIVKFVDFSGLFQTHQSQTSVTKYKILSKRQNTSEYVLFESTLNMLNHHCDYSGNYDVQPVLKKNNNKSLIRYEQDRELINTNINSLCFQIEVSENKSMSLRCHMFHYGGCIIMSTFLTK